MPPTERFAANDDGPNSIRCLIAALGETGHLQIVTDTTDQQRRGVGAALMRAAIEVSRREHQPLICLLGQASYYPQFGFEPARRIGLAPPGPWPDESWLALRLPGWTPALRGVVRYPPAFSGV